MKIDNIPNLKIYKLTEEQYERRLENGEIEENAFYFTPGTGAEAAQPLHVYLYGDEENGYYVDTTVATIFDAVCNQSRDVQLIYETGDYTHIFLLDYCDEETAHFSYQSGISCVTVAIYDDGVVEYSDLHVMSHDYAEKYYLQKPQSVNNTATTYVVGISNNDTTYKLNASKFAIPNCLAKYDANGRLQSKYYDYDGEQYKEDYVATEQYVSREIYSTAPVGFSAYMNHFYEVWMADEDFDNAIEVIYNSWRHAVLYIESEDGEEVEQIWGAKVYNDNDDTNDYIIFGNRYIWYRGDNRLYPYTPPKQKKQYEHIETITLTEPTLEIIRTQEPNGIAYDFEEMIINATFPAYTVSGNANITISYNIGSNWQNRVKSYFLSPYDAASMKIGYNRIWIEGGKYFSGWWTCTKGDGEYASYYENPVTIGRFSRDDGNITKLTLTTVIEIPAGTTFEIWAVRAGSDSTVIPNGDEVSY